MTITQIFTLMLVNSFPLGVIRYAILQSLNSLLSPNSKISASSFYHSLEKLEKLGLLEFLKDEKGKITLVKTTEKTNEALAQVGNVLVMSGINISETISDLSTQILDIIDLESSVDLALIISKDLSLDLHLYPVAEQYAKRIHCVASNIDFNRYIVPYSEKINQTKVINRKMREPDNEFDLTFLPTYFPSDDFFEMSDDEFWQEVVRVTKPQGQIIVLSFKEIKKQDNFILDSIIDLFSSNPLIYFTTKEKIKDSMTKAQIKDINIVDLNGVLLAVGRNS
jgi:DNA-binding PadR family transcriptional regulator